jgi:hypothetical protein
MQADDVISIEYNFREQKLVSALNFNCPYLQCDLLNVFAKTRTVNRRKETAARFLQVSHAGIIRRPDDYHILKRILATDKNLSLKFENRPDDRTVAAVHVTQVYIGYLIACTFSCQVLNFRLDAAAGAHAAGCFF